MVEEEILPERKNDEKGPIGGTIHPVDLQLPEVELKAKWVQQKLELKHMEREGTCGERLEEEKLELEQAIWLKQNNKNVLQENENRNKNTSMPIN